jgi:membrane protein
MTGAHAIRRSPWRIRPDQWWSALGRCLRERADQLTDGAAALTYYGVLSIFPALAVLLSVLGLLGGPASGLNDLIGSIAPGQAGEFIKDAVNQVNSAGATAGAVAAAGLVVAFWSASGYLGAFLRAMDSIYGVDRRRPLLRTLPLRLGLTAIVGMLLIACVFLAVFTGDVARRAGQAMGIGSTSVTVWNVLKWPVLLFLVAVLFALLYRAPSGLRAGGRLWVTPGSLTAVLLWVAVSAAFGLYLTTLASYQRTYGALSGVIVFLIWLWLTNIVVLLGAAIDAELEREDGA